MESAAGFLTSLSSFLFRTALVAFFLINGAALAGFVLTRSRRLVDTWTPRLVAIDAVLLGAGLGVPLLAGLAKLGIRALGGATTGVFSIFR
jgi:hypothetical protein